MQVLFAFSISAVGVSNSTSVAPDTNKAKNSAASMFEIIDSKPKIDSSSNKGMTLTSIQGHIELRHVSFKYPRRPDVQIFQDLSLSIPSGKVFNSQLHKSNMVILFAYHRSSSKVWISLQTLALVGETGSRKLTVISLIERFYTPDSGQIFLDVEIEKFQLSWLRQQMGLVSQEPILFNETIRQNTA